MGADEFIRKPFSQRLLVERVKAVLRRAAPRDGAMPKDAQNEVLERGLLRMDPERHTCTWKDVQVALTVTEFLILQALASRPGIVKSRNALMLLTTTMSMSTIGSSTAAVAAPIGNPPSLRQQPAPSEDFPFSVEIRRAFIDADVIARGDE